MGISGFSSFFRDCIVKRKTNNYIGKKIVIDASYQLYRYGIAIRKNGSDICNDEGKSLNHLYAIMYYTIFLLNSGVSPIYVFDGKAPEIKKHVIKNRNNEREKYISKLSTVNKNSEEYIKNFRRLYRFGTSEINECMKLLDYMDIPYIRASGEADVYCSKLSRHPDIYGVISNDSDLLVFGTKNLIKNFTGKNNIDELSLIEVYKYMKFRANEINYSKNRDLIARITHENLIDFAILLGSDYVPNIKNYNNDQIFEIFVDNNMNLEKTVDSLKPYYVPNNYLEKAYQAKNYYLESSRINIDSYIEKLTKNTIQPNVSKLYDFLYNLNRLEKNIVDDFVKKLCSKSKVISIFNTSNKDKIYDSMISYQWKYYNKLEYRNNKNDKINNMKKHNLNIRKFSNKNNSKNYNRNNYTIKKNTINKKEKMYNTLNA